MTKQALKNSYRKLVRRAGRLQFPLLAVLALAIMVTGYVCVANDPFEGSYFRTRPFKAAESGPQQTDDGRGYTRKRFKRVETGGPVTTGEAHPFQNPDRRTEASDPQPEVPFAALVPAEPVAIPAPRAFTEDSLDLASPAGSARRGLSEHHPPEEIAPTHLPALSRAERFSGELFSSESIAVPRAAAPSAPAGTPPATPIALPPVEEFSGELFSSEAVAVPRAAAPSAPAGTPPATPTALLPVEEFSGELFSSEAVSVPADVALGEPAGPPTDAIDLPLSKRRAVAPSAAAENSFILGELPESLPPVIRAEAALQQRGHPATPESIVAATDSGTPAAGIPDDREAVNPEGSQEPAQIISARELQQRHSIPSPPLAVTQPQHPAPVDRPDAPARDEVPLGLPPVVDRVEQPFAGPFPPATVEPVESRPVVNAKPPSVAPEVPHQRVPTPAPRVPAEAVLAAPPPVVDQFSDPLVGPAAALPIAAPTPSVSVEAELASPPPVVDQLSDPLVGPAAALPIATPTPSVSVEAELASPPPVVDQLSDPLVGPSAPLPVEAGVPPMSVPAAVPPPSLEVPYDPVLSAFPIPVVSSAAARPALSTPPLTPVSDSRALFENQVLTTDPPPVAVDPLQPIAAEQPLSEAVPAVDEQGEWQSDRLTFACPASWYVRVEMPHLNREGNKGVSYSTGFRLDDFDFEPGGRMTLGRQRDCLEGWELTFTGMFEWEVADLRDHRTFDQTASGDPEFFTTLVPIGVDASSFEGAPYQASRFRSRFDSLELLKKRWGWDVISCSSGVRYIDVSEEFELYSIAPDDSIGHLTMDTQNKMLGFQLGVDFYYPVGRWTMEGNLKGSLNGNLARGQFRLENGGPFPDFGTLYGNDFSSVRLATMVELGYHVSYHISERVKIRGGYEVLWLYGVAAAVEQLRDGTLKVNTGTHAETDYAIIYHGGTFGFEIAW